MNLSSDDVGSLAADIGVILSDDQSHKMVPLSNAGNYFYILVL